MTIDPILGLSATLNCCRNPHPEIVPQGIDLTDLQSLQNGQRHKGHSYEDKPIRSQQPAFRRRRIGFTVVPPEGDRSREDWFTMVKARPCPWLFFDIKGIPAHRREWIEAAVRRWEIGGGQVPAAMSAAGERGIKKFALRTFKKERSSRYVLRYVGIDFEVDNDIAILSQDVDDPYAIPLHGAKSS